MDVIEELKRRLFKYPSLTYQSENADSVSVAPASADGFSVTLTVASNGYVVYFDGWHEEFKSAEGALNCFEFGLSLKCRLKVFRRDNCDFKWTVESRSGTNWVEDSTTGLLFYPFWQKEKIVYRQNAVLAEKEQDGD